MDFPENAPRIIVAGDSVSWTVTQTQHPPSEWDMQLVILADTPLAFVAGNDGKNFLVALDSADTSTIPQGNWGFCYVFTNIADNTLRDTVGNWPVAVQPDPLLPRTPSWAQLRLAEINAAIAKLTLTANKSVSIDGQTYTKRDLKELLDMRNYFLVLVNNELRALGLLIGGVSRKIVTRFVS